MRRGIAAVLASVALYRAITAPLLRGYVRDELRFTDASVGASFSIQGDVRLLESVSSPFQHIQIYAHSFFGKIMVIDGDLQLTARDECIYHEMIAHVPLSLIFASERNPKVDVLIIGGGDGGVCSEILKRPGVRAVTVCDIDSEVTRLSRKHFPWMARKCFEDDRVKTVHESGEVLAERLLARNHSFDVVIVDSTEFGASTPLFSDDFHVTLRDLVKPKGGVVVINLTSLAWHAGAIGRAAQRNKDIYRHVAPFGASIPTYMSGHYGMLVSSDAIDATSSQTPIYVDDLDSQHLCYYSKAMHRAAFALPQSVRRAIQVQRQGSLPMEPHVYTACDLIDCACVAIIFIGACAGLERVMTTKIFFIRKRDKSTKIH